MILYSISVRGEHLDRTRPVLHKLVDLAPDLFRLTRSRSDSWFLDVKVSIWTGSWTEPVLQKLMTLDRTYVTLFVGHFLKVHKIVIM